MMLLRCSWLSAGWNPFQGHQVDINDQSISFCFLFLLLCSLSNLIFFAARELLWLWIVRIFTLFTMHITPHRSTSFHMIHLEEFQSQGSWIWPGSQDVASTRSDIDMPKTKTRRNSKTFISTSLHNDGSWCPIDSSSQGYCSTWASAECADYAERIDCITLRCIAISYPSLSRSEAPTRSPSCTTTLRFGTLLGKLFSNSMPTRYLD